MSRLPMANYAQYKSAGLITSALSKDTVKDGEPQTYSYTVNEYITSSGTQEERTHTDTIEKYQERQTSRLETNANNLVSNTEDGVFVTDAQAIG